MSDQSLPGVPEVAGPETTEEYEAMLQDEQEEAVRELEEADYDTDLGLAMAADARRVSNGELTSEEYWEKYDEAAVNEFGERYEETPNPAVDHIDQTIDEAVAQSLSCDSCSVDDVAEESVTLPDAEDSGRDGEGPPQWGMVIDLQKCVGCESCTTACKAENRTPPGVSYNVVMEREHGEFPNVTRTHVPRPCLQCQNPPCVQVCPITATYKMDNGVTTIDYDRCFGCRYCVVACPYGARYFDFGETYDEEFDENDEVEIPEYGTPRSTEKTDGQAMKCNYCHHRLERGEEPACVETCIGDARYMGDLSDSDSEVAEMASKQRAFRLKEKQGTDPNMYYLK